MEIQTGGWRSPLWPKKKPTIKYIEWLEQKLLLAVKMLKSEEISFFDDEVLIEYIKFVTVDEQEPPTGVQLLAKDPSGEGLYYCTWIPEYNIFSCQKKGENSGNWKWGLA